MKIYIKKEDGGILMHSDTYLGEDYVSPNLVHWKYIKKERKNGRWVYYYDDPQEQQLRNNITNAKEERDQHKYLAKEYSNLKKNGPSKNDPWDRDSKGNYKLGSTVIKYKNGKESDKYENYNFKTVDEAINTHNKKAINKNKEYLNAKNKYDKYNNKFKVKIKKIAVKTLNQLSNNIYKAKKFLKSIFG